MSAEDMPLGADNVLDLCLRLRMACNGSADPILDEERDAAIAFLRHRLDNWKPSCRWAERFDEAVRALILATIAEVLR